MKTLSDVLGAANLSQVGRMSREAILELDDRLAECAAASSPRSPASGEYRAMLPPGASVDGPELHTAIAYAHSTAIVDPIDRVLFDETALYIISGMCAGSLAAGKITIDEAPKQMDNERRKMLAAMLFREEGLREVRAALAAAVEFLAEWEPVLAAGLLYTVPARVGVRGMIIDETRNPILAPDLLGPEAVVAALSGLPWEVAYEQARGAFMSFNSQLLLARAAGASPVAEDEVSWRYLQLLAGRGTLPSAGATGRTHHMLTLSPLPGIGQMRPDDALRLHKDVDEFADWHLRLRRVGRHLASQPSDEDFEQVTKELLEEELEPAIRRLRQKNGAPVVLVETHRSGGLMVRWLQQR